MACSSLSLACLEMLVVISLKALASESLRESRAIGRLQGGVLLGQ